MSNTVANIVLGLNAANTLKVGALDAVEGDAVDVGLIKGGIKIDHDESQYEVEVDQFIGTVKKFITKESMKVTLSIAEPTLANLAVAFGYPTGAVASTTFSFGAKTSVTERTLYINVNGPAGVSRKITLWKCVPTGKTSQAYTKEKETLVDVEFDVLVHSSKTAEQRFGTEVDTAADTTPPTVALSTPTDGNTVVGSGSGTVVWTISEAADANSIIYGDTFSIIDDTTPGAATLKAGTIVYNSTLYQVVFTPTAAWTNAHTYQAIVTTGLKDVAGNRLAAIKLENFSATTP